MSVAPSEAVHGSGQARDDAVIEVRGLRKSYGDHEVVRGIDLEVRHGEVFAFLGPNGAGKTTTVEILEGYRSRNAGEVSVLGVDPAAADRQWRSRVGLVLQSCTMPAELTVRELVELYAGYYPHPRPAARDDRARRPDRAARRTHRPALRWAAAPPRRRAGADRRPRARVPRRADDRLRPLGSPPRLGGDREPARARQDDLPHHALHGRGAGAGGPRGGDRRGRDRRRGHARDARRPRSGDERRLLRPPAASAAVSELPQELASRRAAARRSCPHRRRGARAACSTCSPGGRSSTARTWAT